MVVDGAVRFTSETGAKYGFTIRNTSPETLVPQLFFFDPDEYTIQKWYPSDKQNGMPLQANTGTLTRGMGEQKAYEFVLPRDKRESSGFFKLFVTREVVDLGWIEQPVPLFDAKYPDVDGRNNKKKLDPTLVWDALTVTLTMTAQ
ncbi:hypothetical protein B0H19DRAFT_1118275 [Mycena capillaripes]|nr:hypothetical protein B0H19DRAFT_1118275 [Mycena capillaripes]